MIPRKRFAKHMTWGQTGTYRGPLIRIVQWAIFENLNVDAVMWIYHEMAMADVV